MRGVLLVLLATVVSACSPTENGSPPGSTTVNPAPGLEAPAAPAEGIETRDPTSDQAAVDLVLLYYGAISEGDLRAAYEMWGPDGPPGVSFGDFQRDLEQETPVAASVEKPTDAEGAAGSIFVSIPVNVTTMADGEDRRYEGDYVLRRVDNVPDAEPWQLRWHIASAELRRIE